MTENQMVYKGNALIEASYRLTPAEQRIILACIAQVRRDQPITDEVMYSVSAADYAALVGTESHSVYEDLAAAALRLKRREVWIKEKPNGRGQRESVLVTGWVQSIRYIKSEGRVELRFARDMLPYLAQLTEQFTRYALSDVARMDSAYAIRLYELLVQWRDAGQREVSIDWLRDILQLDDKYPSINDLKKRVIEPAVAQINELSPLWVQWEQRKTGRRVTHLVFSFGPKDLKGTKTSQKPRGAKSRSGSSSNPNGGSNGGSGWIYGIPRAVIEAKALPGETYEEAARRLAAKRTK